MKAIIAIILLTTPPPIWAQVLDMLIFAGQSNAVGFCADPALLPSDSSDKDIMFWWRCGDPPPDDHDSMSKVWTHLQPQARGMPAKKKSAPRQYGNFANSAGGFGPEIAMARTLIAKEQRPLAVLKAAFNGTGLRTDWNPTSMAADGDCYRALVTEVRKAIESAKIKSLTFRLRAFIWVQGESDANSEDAALYERRLGEMVIKLRQDLSAPSMAVLVGVNTNFGMPQNPLIRKVSEAQKALCTHLTNSAYVDTSGSSYTGGAHFDALGTLDIGKRFADALAQLEMKRR